ncbi:hypothetical protein [Actinoplanes sp. HUAS TT8]|uniref:hypothetical protein n=1 Tax=Actinoplanes sp. HUAS TT8 TaxID=3447453 RepID=UPI003F5210F9
MTIILIISAVIMEVRKSRVEGLQVSTGSFNDSEAIKLLAGADVGTRMSGVQHLARSSAIERGDPQWYVKVICQYLRRPYDPVHAPPGERDVRVALIELLAEHLQYDAIHSWSEYDIDLTGATLDAGVLDGAVLRGSEVRLSSCRFVGGGFSWMSAIFVDCIIDCSSLELCDGDLLSFAGSSFVRTKVALPGLVVSGGTLDLNEIKTEESQFDFVGMVMTAGAINVVKAQIGRWSTFGRRDEQAGRRGWALDLRESELRGGTISFSGTRLMDQERGRKKRLESELTMRWQAAAFSYSQLLGTQISFEDCRLVLVEITFQGATIEGSQISFRRTDFRGSTVNFVESVIADGSISFRACWIRQAVHPEKYHVPGFLKNLLALTEEEQAQHYYHHLGIPQVSAVSFAVAMLRGGSIDFDSIETDSGIVVDFNHATVTGTAVRFTDGQWSYSLIILWHLYFESGPGSFTGSSCTPCVLLSGNMTKEERRRVDLENAIYFAVRDTH